MLTPTIPELLEEEGDLLTLPHTIHQVIALLDSPGAGVDELVSVVSNDIVLTIKLLRLVNSPYYGLSAKIDSVKQAIDIVGMKTLRDLVIATKVAERFNHLPERLFSMRTFWDNALVGATLAQAISRHTGHHADHLFAPALLRDVGALLMLWKMPEAMAAAFARAREQRCEIQQAEVELFGYSHAEVGARLMEGWGLPGRFAVIARYQQQFYNAPAYRREIAVVHLAATLAQRYRPWLNCRSLDNLPDMAAFELVPLGTLPMEQLAVEVASYPEVGTLFN